MEKHSCNWVCRAVLLKLLYEGIPLEQRKVNMYTEHSASSYFICVCIVCERLHMKVQNYYSKLMLHKSIFILSKIIFIFLHSPTCCWLRNIGLKYMVQIFGNIVNYILFIVIDFGKTVSILNFKFLKVQSLWKLLFIIRNK